MAQFQIVDDFTFEVCLLPKEKAFVCVEKSDFMPPSPREVSPNGDERSTQTKRLPQSALPTAPSGREPNLLTDSKTGYPRGYPVFV